MGPKLVLLLCVAVACPSVRCETKISDDGQKARLPELLTDLDLASLEASDDDIEALKTVVKRLAPEKNGEYQVYQGVMGQPGVDFPVLTTIPTTTFSCRGIKGGYYADLETHCQVFHICDNGRKISFLCPNGTVFQQSQLICDWWFKVDCGKSAELYEQSAEQLAEDERKRAEAKKMTSEFHRNSENDQGQTYYRNHNQNLEYDGKQNGRTNPFSQASVQNQELTNQQNGRTNPFSSQASAQNQESTNQQNGKSNQFNQNQIYSQQQNGRIGGQFTQTRIFNNQENGRTNPFNQNYNQKQQQTQNVNNYQTINRQQNQLSENQNGGPHQFATNYNLRNGNKQQPQNQNTQEYYGAAANLNAQQGEKENFRNVNTKTTLRNNFNNQPQRVTPVYTETTTYRTTTSNPFKEYQQPAESAGFATGRGYRYNKGFNANQLNSFYSNRFASTENYKTEVTTAAPNNGKGSQFGSGGNNGGTFVLPFPTFAPIYKPRTTTAAPYADTEPTTTTQKPYVNTELYRHNTVTPNTYSNFETVTPTAQDFPQNTGTSASYGNTENYQQNTVTPEAYNTEYRQDTTNPSTQRSYLNTETYKPNQITSTTSRPYEDVAGYNGNTVTGRIQEPNIVTASTQRPYVNTETYRHNTATAGTVTPTTGQYAGNYENTATQPTGTYYESGESDRKNVVSVGTERQYENTPNNEQNFISSSTEDPSDDTGNYQQQSTNLPTENPFRITQNDQQNTVTGKTLSPYDTSFTYKQGKITSTLGPYIPFTKNYAYTTTTTQKPPVYTATVPTYSSTAYQTTAQNPTNKGVVSTYSTVGGAVRESTVYSPIATTETPAYFPTTKSVFDNEASTIREHAISMLHSLQGLEGNAPNVNNQTGNRLGLNVPPSSGPSTLHSLALYFATASDNFDSNETNTDTAVNIDNRGSEDDDTTTDNNISVELPTSLLTQHTINSYTGLFNLNTALESNGTTQNRFGGDADESALDDGNNNDLDIQQSEGPIEGVKKSNNPKLRELAQVFTHALSAYLQDPDTFRKVLTEIRPTEPPSTSGNDVIESTTSYPTTQDDYPSVTKEKDEVLDFSDVNKASRRRRPTTPYPTTLPTLSTVGDTTYQPYYTTAPNDYTTSATAFQSQYPTTTPATIDESLNEAQTGYFRSPVEPTGNTFAFEVNHAFGSANSNDIQNYPTGPSGSSNDYGNSYSTGVNRFGGFQNNTGNTPEPYGKYVKPFDATPISDNYVSSSTPASYEQSPVNGENVQIIANSNPQTDLSPPRIHTYINTENVVTSGYFKPEEVNGLVASPEVNPTTLVYRENEVFASTRQPFRINYFESSTKNPTNDAESLVTAGSLYSTYRNKYNDVQINFKSTERPAVTESVTPNGGPTTDRGDFETTAYSTTHSQNEPVTTTQDSQSSVKYTDRPINDHWTSSPAVTKLWETTVFLDPKHINHGLTSYPKATESTEFDSVATGGVEYGTTPLPKQEILVTDASGGIATRNFNTNPPSPWQWAPNDNDSPTAFTLLPTTYPTENTATPSPTYTTHSSIITTITSSVSSSTNPVAQETDIPTPLPFRIDLRSFNVTENEIIKAQEMFGNLNATSSNTLMRVMKQADNDTTVRQLVLLLISHCNGPMNKTMEEEKEQLLNALLKMPVNEFSTEESRDIVAGINKLRLPIGGVNFNARSNKEPETRSVSTALPAATTFRSMKGRKFRTTTETPSTLSRRSDEIEIAESSNSLSIEDGSPSDNRALELLRSLYTIAAKWG